MAGETRLTEAQESVLQTLLQILPQLLPSYQSIEQSSFGWAHLLGQYRETYGMNVANALRQEAGGDVGLQSAVGLEGLLNLVARDAYPLLLLPTRSDWPAHLPVGLSLNFFNHPVREQFDQVVLSDSDLSQLFPDDDEHAGRRGSVLRSTGQGGSVQLIMFAELLIRNAWTAATSDLDDPTPAQLCEYVQKNLSTIRSATRG